MPLPLVEQLALALAAGVASGLNAYASVAMLGLLQRYDVIHLPAPLSQLAHPWVIGAALVLFAIEFVADKVPYLDNVWDAVHTFIRVPIGAWLAGAVFADQGGAWQAVMTAVGGGLALQSHGTKASARLAVNASPEPFSNWLLSFSEDAFVVFLMWIAAAHPYIALAILAAVIVLLFLLIRTIFRALKRLFTKRSQPGVVAQPKTAG